MVHSFVELLEFLFNRIFFQSGSDSDGEITNVQKASQMQDIYEKPQFSLKQVILWHVRNCVFTTSEKRHFDDYFYPYSYCQALLPLDSLDVLGLSCGTSFLGSFFRTMRQILTMVDCFPLIVCLCLLDVESMCSVPFATRSWCRCGPFHKS